MACIESDGTLTLSGTRLIKSLAEQPMSPEEIAKAVREPIFKVRGNLRELAGAELIREEGGLYHLTDEGRRKL
jgi:predicted transcriptional regulator